MITLPRCFGRMVRSSRRRELNMDEFEPYAFARMQLPLFF